MLRTKNMTNYGELLHLIKLKYMENGSRLDPFRKIEELKSAWPEVNLQGLLRGIYQNPDHADAILSHLYELGWNPPSVGD